MKSTENRVLSKSNAAHSTPQTKTTIRTERRGPKKDKGVWIKLNLPGLRTPSRYKLTTPEFTRLKAVADRQGVSVSRGIEIALSTPLPNSPLKGLSYAEINRLTIERVPKPGNTFQPIVLRFKDTGEFLAEDDETAADIQRAFPGAKIRRV